MRECLSDLFMEWREQNQNLMLWKRRKIFCFLWESGTSHDSKMWGRLLHADASHSAYMSDAVSLEYSLFGITSTKFSPWLQWAHRGFNLLKRIWKTVAHYRGCVETTQEIWRGFSSGLRSDQLDSRDLPLARSSEDDSLFQSDKVSEGAWHCMGIW